jgi:hypothetical protein
MATIHITVEHTSYLGKMRGLIGHKHPKAIVLHTRFGIHTVGVLFPIDVLILSKHHSVVAKKENLKPNRLFFWNPLFDIVIELPAGSIVEKKINIGDTIFFS